MGVVDLPWLHACLELVELRRGDRVLQLGAHGTALTRATLEVCGEDGLVVVLEPDAARIEAVAKLDHPALHFANLELDVDAELGRFDAVLACPLWSPELPLEQWGHAARQRLRPGGRFVIDLPAGVACEIVDAAWREALGEADSRRRRWHGAPESEVARALRDAGLRNVEGVVGTHLVHVESPRALAELAFAGLDEDDDAEETLALALASRLGTIGEAEVVFHRTRVFGMR